MLHPLSSTRNFNEEVATAIDAALSEILGERALDVLHNYLKEHYDIGADEMPYRLPTVIRVLEEVFGVTGTRAIGVDVAKKLYSQLGLKFDAHTNYTFRDYVAQVEKLLLAPE